MRGADEPAEGTGRDTADVVALHRLLAAYADVVNRRAWPELHDLFLPDAEVRVETHANPPIALTGPAALGDFVGAAIARFDFFEFVVLNAHFELGTEGDSDAAAGRVFMCELRHTAEGGDLSQAFGLYRDRYARRHGRWWFAGRRYDSLARTGADLEVLGLPPDVSH